MKFKTYILTIIFLVYITELMALSLCYKPAIKVQNSYVRKAEPGCFNKRIGNCEKPPVKECNTGNTCASGIPLGCVTTSSGYMLPVDSAGLIKRIYRAYQSFYMYAYSRSAWKPPNGA